MQELGAKMIDQQILSEVFDRKIVDIIKSLLSHDSAFFSIRELADNADVTVSTTFRIVQSLEKVGFVKKIQRGRIKFFEIQKSSKAYRQLSELFGQKVDMIELIKSEAQEIIGEEVELHTQKKDKKKIFLITNKELDESELTDRINSVTGQKIKIMCISRDQFGKMKDMGLI